ncbi:MAG: Uma2 family endonuclease [Tunicatimonas sp.]|uniref:Uma2 family endonuclease n=1 Tax=Tunicatimonas sp. TaxID=1940096 RepID=UPI003C783487
MEPQQKNYLTIAEYLQVEKDTGVRYEYHDGMIQAMAGGSYDHTTISGNIYSELRIKLRSRKNNGDGGSRKCVASSENRKIYIPSKNLFLYPDASVVCGVPERTPQEPGAVTNPTLIAEVLSKSTEGRDPESTAGGDKFHLYCLLPTFQEYLLIQQYRVAVEVRTKTKDGSWKITAIEGVGQTIELSSLNISLSIEALYEDTQDLSEFLNKS